MHIEDDGYIYSYGERLYLIRTQHKLTMKDMAKSVGVVPSTWSKYVKAPRPGRGVRLDRKTRMRVWKVFEEYRTMMDAEKVCDAACAMNEFLHMVLLQISLAEVSLAN